MRTTADVFANRQPQTFQLSCGFTCNGSDKEFIPITDFFNIHLPYHSHGIRSDNASHCSVTHPLHFSIDTL
jgi:hypothetical protein